MNEQHRLMAAFGLGISMLTAEHFFSAGMSSPWSVAKFAKTADDQQQVWTLFTEAAVASTIFAIVLGFLLDDGAFWWSVGGTVAVVVWMWWDYKRALEGAL